MAQVKEGTRSIVEMARQPLPVWVFAGACGFVVLGVMLGDAYVHRVVNRLRRRLDVNLPSLPRPSLKGLDSLRSAVKSARGVK